MGQTVGLSLLVRPCFFQSLPSGKFPGKGCSWCQEASQGSQGACTRPPGIKRTLCGFFVGTTGLCPYYVRDMNLIEYDLILVNSSAGKDSQAMLSRLVSLALVQGVSLDRFCVVHADLGRVEWKGTREEAA